MNAYKIPSQQRPVFLIGMPGVGKSVTAHALAHRLNWVWHDTDTMMLAAYPTYASIIKIFNVLGERAFRAEEFEQLKAAVINSPVVVSTGGGCATNPQSHAWLCQQTQVVFLKAEYALIQQRLQDGQRNPSLLTHFDERQNLYQSLAQLTVKIEASSTIQQNVNRIVACLGLDV